MGGGKGGFTFLLVQTFLVNITDIKTLTTSFQVMNNRIKPITIHKQEVLLVSHCGGVKLQSKSREQLTQGKDRRDIIVSDTI